MASAPAKAPGRILGVPTKWAVVIVLVVFVGVWYYLKNRSTGVATQTQTTPQVAATGSTDSTGGVSQAPDLSSLLDALAQNTAAITGLTTGSGTYASPDTSTQTQPTTSNYYNAPYESPSTTSYTYNYTGATPPVQQGQINDAGVPAYSSYTSLGVAAPTGTISAGMAGGTTGSAEVKLVLQQATLRPSVGKNVPQ